MTAAQERVANLATVTPHLVPQLASVDVRAARYACARAYRRGLLRDVDELRDILAMLGLT